VCGPDPHPRITSGPPGLRTRDRGTGSSGPRHRWEGAPR